MSKVLVLPDIHGRLFWKEPCKDLNDYDKVVFLGDYFDPYRYGEDITEESAIENFKEILELKKSNPEKVVLLLGNHDMPYYSLDYLKLHHSHSRYSRRHHGEMEALFDAHHDLFVYAFAMDNILFTHAGVIREWYVGELGGSVDDSVETVCNRVNAIKGDVGKFFKVGGYRGGWDRYSSCMWADVHEMMDQEKKATDDGDTSPLVTMRQIFGHTLHAHESYGGRVEILDPIIGNNFMMLDNCEAYVIDTDTFEIAWASGNDHKVFRDD